MKKLVAVTVLDGYRLRLRFEDGVDGVVDFSSKPRTGVFARWEDYQFFRQARIGSCGELVWDDQIDFCPDALWLQVTGQPAEALDSQLLPLPAFEADGPGDFARTRGLNEDASQSGIHLDLGFTGIRVVFA